MKSNRKQTRQQIMQRALALAIDHQIKSHTFVQYSQAPSINSFNDQTFDLNNIKIKKVYDDFCNIFTANEQGLYEWCVKLQVGTIALFQIWFKNIRYMDNNEHPTTDQTTLTPANFANGNGDVTQQDNPTAGNYNETYGIESLTLEQIRLVILMKYYSKEASGSIDNLYDVLTTFVSFYYNQHRPSTADYDPSKNVEFLVIDCLVNSEFQYQGLMCIYHTRNLWQPYDGSSSVIESQKLQYVFEQSGILPRNIGQIIKFIYTPTLPTEQDIKDYYLNPQKDWSEGVVASEQLGSLPNNMITKTWCSKGDAAPYPDPDCDLSIVPDVGDNDNDPVNLDYGFNKAYARALPTTQAQQELLNTAPSFKKLIDKLEDKGIFSKDEKLEVLTMLTQSLQEAVHDVVVTALAPTRQNMNGILRQTWDNILFYNQGQQIDWSPNIIYQKGAEIREYNPDDHHHLYVYWISSVDNNTSPRPTINSHVNWDWIFCIDINGFIHFNHNIYAPIVTITNPNNNYITECNGDNIIIRDQYLNALMKLNDKHLELYNTAGDLLSNYSFDNSKVTLSMANQFKDVNMQHQIGYREIIYNNNPRAVLYYLSGGLVIFSGIMMTNADGLFSFNIPQLKTLTNLAGDNQVPVYCSIIQDSSSPNHNLFAVAELSNNNITITGKSFIMTTGQGVNADIAILVIGILANYVGDTLAKIRAYKSSFYYDDLPEDKKLQLRQYYIGLDETKDLTKVTAPAWLEAELDGKELA